jgi:hypothetical protein
MNKAVPVQTRKKSLPRYREKADSVEQAVLF